MSKMIFVAWLAALGPLSTASAQQTAAPQIPAGKTRSAPVKDTSTAVALRATLVRPGGIVTVDRGERDGLRVGDRIVFHPLGQRSLHARVRSVQNRAAEVQLVDPNAMFEIGTRGIVRVPNARFAAPPPVEEPPSEPLPEHAPWENSDEEYVLGMPLLAEVDGVLPEDRVPLLSGRIFSIGSTRITSDDNRRDSFYRVGTELNFENPFGKGGQLNFEGEGNYRETYVENQVDEAVTKGRIDRISYSWGGTRFQPVRQEVGRFLQRGIPEFGILDGYEWSQRLASGDSVGTSMGFMPEPTPSMSTGQDLAFSSFYRWTADQRERVTATGAYQKTWHNGAADRDLFIGKFDYWETEGWDMHATAWLDYYTSGDEAKGSGLDLTRMIASTSRRWDDGDGMTFTYTRRTFPQLDRNEFVRVLEEQLANNRYDRIATDGWWWLNPEKKLHSRLGVWSDQDDSGLDGNMGIEQLGVFRDNGRLDASFFGVGGKFSTTYGFRLDYGIQLTRQRWDLSYEYSLNDQVGFNDNSDDLEQHRFIGSFDHTSDSGWSFSFQGGTIFWAQETTLIASFYIQKGF